MSFGMLWSLFMMVYIRSVLLTTLLSTITVQSVMLGSPLTNFPWKSAGYSNMDISLIRQKCLSVIDVDVAVVVWAAPHSIKDCFKRNELWSLCFCTPSVIPVPLWKYGAVFMTLKVNHPVLYQAPEMNLNPPEKRCQGSCPLWSV